MDPQTAGADLETIRRAYRIAVRDLRACYNPEGIVAGRLHFNAYWARDGFWALFGALALGDYDQARAHLDLFIRYQMPSGQLPVRIEFLGHTFGHYHTRRMQPKALYRAGTIFAEPLDPTALFVIAAREYFLRTHDLDFCSRFEPVMDRGARWLKQHDRDGDAIIENNFLAGWMDSILKKDKVFYLKGDARRLPPGQPGIERHPRCVKGSTEGGHDAEGDPAWHGSCPGGGGHHLDALGGRPRARGAPGGAHSLRYVRVENGLQETQHSAERHHLWRPA